MSGTDKISVGDPMPMIESVTPQPGCSIRVRWSAGRRQGMTSDVNLAPMIYSFKIFAPLRDDAALFATAHVVEDGAAIAWGDDDQIDIAATTVENLADEAMTPADFAEFLRRNRLSLDAAAAQLGISRRLIAYYAKEREIPRYIALACAYIDKKNEHSSLEAAFADVPSIAFGANFGVLSGMLNGVVTGNRWLGSRATIWAAEHDPFHPHGGTASSYAEFTGLHGPSGPTVITVGGATIVPGGNLTLMTTNQPKGFFIVGPPDQEASAHMRISHG